MPTYDNTLKDQKRANRDSNLSLAHKMRERGNAVLVQRYVSIAKRWQKELSELEGWRKPKVKRETRH